MKKISVERIFQSHSAVGAWLFKIIIVAGVYFFAARLGLLLAFEETNACPVWPPTGVALAAVLVLGYRVWPGIAVGAFLANIISFIGNGHPPGMAVIMSCIIGSGNTLEAVLGAFLIRQSVGHWSPFERARDVFKFIMFGAVIATTVSATIGVSSLYLGGIAAPADFAYLWWTWWIGDAVGTLVVAPALIVLAKPVRIPWKSAKVAEIGLILGILVSVTLLAFRFPPGLFVTAPFRLEILIMPIIVWATFRSGHYGATLSLLIVAAIGVWRTSQGSGPCAVSSSNDSLLLAQSYLAIIAVTALILMAVLNERKNVNAQLRESESSLAKAQQIAHLGNWDWNIGRDKVFCSQEICRIFGLEHQEPEMTYEIFLNCVHRDDREFVRESVNAALAGTKPYNIDHRIVLPNGNKRVVHEQAEVLYDDVGNPVRMVGTIQDITERKNSEQKLQSYAAELQRSNMELQDFANIASHDLQEPLRKVKVFSDRLLKEMDSNISQKGLEYLHRMQNAVDRMQSLISALLGYSRVTTRAQPFIPTDLSEVVREVLTDLEIRLEQTEGRVEIGTLPTIEADPSQMQQLFMNLIGNSLKFHRAGEKPVVEIMSQSLHDWPPDGSSGAKEFCQIMVKDNGIGFDEKHLDRIFKVFQRLHGRSEYEGSGIGLAICRKIVQRHGGHITAKSAPGNGCSFFVSLPVKRAGREDEGERRFEMSRSPVSG
jgi:PAS domain S-box-containing protein